jgi:glycosyltransferase involved in cell wall biosynthesis
LRIAIDAIPAVDKKKTGVGWYTHYLIHWLPAVDQETDYTAWYLHARDLFNKHRFFEDQENLRERGIPFPARVWQRLSNRTGMPRVEWTTRFDAFFAPNYIPPATRTKGLVVTVHDLAFKILPETAPHANRFWHRYFEQSLAQAAEIITVSHATRNDLCEIYDIPPEKVTAVLSGVDLDVFKPSSEADIEETKEELGIEGPYLLFVGGLEPRKNLRMLLRAFSQLPEELRPTLVLAGAPVHWIPGGPEIMTSALRALPDDVSGKVVMTGYVSEKQKVALLSGAEALVYPSVYEGFGMPVLEAMACGTPVLTSNVSSLPEVAGDAAILVDPYETSAIADGMRELLTDEELRSRLSEAGLARAQQFTWAETARQTAKVLHRAADRTR